MIAERDFQILRGIVDLYVRDGVPVSSGKIKDFMGLPLSTATIRNSMARLEHDGLICKPHTSAGRVPVDRGYRVYVDRMEIDTSIGEMFSARIRDELREQAHDVGAIMAATSRILGGLTKQFAVVYGSVVQESRVGRLQLIDLEGTRLLVVVTMTPEHERTAVLRMERRYPADVVSRAEGEINRVVAGHTLGEARQELAAAIRDNMTDEGIIAREVAVHREEIFSEPPAVELYFEDRGHLLSQPELADPKLLQLLLRLLHNKQYLTSILSERVGERMRITIGGENDDVELEPFSLVTAGYRIGVSRGVLGVIGPTRMRYDLVHGLVGSAARELGAIGEEYF